MRPRNRTAVVSATILAFAGAGLVFAGLGIYPDDSPLRVPSAPELTVLGDGTPFDTLSVDVVPRGGDDAVSVGAGRYSYPNDYAPEQLDDAIGVAVLLPRGRRLDGGCPASAQCSRTDDDRLLVGLIILPEVRGDSAFGTSAFRIAGHGTGYAADDAGARVVFPALDSGTTRLERFTVRYPVVGAGRLEWLGQPPSDTADDSAAWDLDASTGRRTLVEDVATDPSAASASSFALFMSGSLFALGTSALLALIPELVRLRHD